MDLVFFNQKSELNGYFAIYLSSSQIVGNGPLFVCDICYPIVAVHVGDAEEIQAIDTEPQVLEYFTLLDSPETHTDIGSFVGWCTELLTLKSAVGRTEGQTVGKGEAQGHLPAVCPWEIVREVQVYGPPLVCRQGNPLTVHLLARTHHGEGEPLVGTWHKLTVELQVKTCCVA